jgi:hypothetical protein
MKWASWAFLAFVGALAFLVLVIAEYQMNAGVKRLKEEGAEAPEVTNGDRHIHGRIHVPAHVHIAGIRHHGQNGCSVRGSSYTRIREFSSNDHRRYKLTVLDRCLRRCQRLWPSRSASQMRCRR